MTGQILVKSDLPPGLQVVCCQVQRDCDGVELGVALSVLLVRPRPSRSRCQCLGPRAAALCGHLLVGL